MTLTREEAKSRAHALLNVISMNWWFIGPMIGDLGEFIQAKRGYLRLILIEMIKIMEDNS